MWIYGTEGNPSYHDTVSISKDTLMPNGKSYAIVQHGGDLGCTPSLPDGFQRQDGSVIYQYLPCLAAEYPIYKFDLHNLDIVSIIPLPRDTMRIHYYQQSVDSMFGEAVVASVFAFDPSRLTLDEEFFDSIVDSIGLIKREYAWFSMILSSAVINGVSYGTVTDVPSTSVETPSVAFLEHNYPNPFNSTTTISFSLNKPLSTTIRIYDILGREASQDPLGMLDPGFHSYTLQSDNLASGVYFYRIITRDYTLAGRMVLTK